MNPFFPGGEFSQEAWIAFWSALWSAPAQPGYAKLVRVGLDTLQTTARTLLAVAEANDTETGADSAIDLLTQAIDQLNTYRALAIATDDGAKLKEYVVDPLLVDGPQPGGTLAGAQPLMKIGRAFPLVIAIEPLRDWKTIAKQEIVEPVTEAAKAVAKAGFPWVAVLIAAAIALVAFRYGRGGAGL